MSTATIILDAACKLALAVITLAGAGWLAKIFLELFH